MNMLGRLRNSMGIRCLGVCAIPVWGLWIMSTIPSESVAAEPVSQTSTSLPRPPDTELFFSTDFRSPRGTYPFADSTKEVATDEPRRSDVAVFLEFLGLGLYNGLVNIDYRPIDNFSARAGVGVWFNLDTAEPVTTSFPIAANFLVGEEHAMIGSVGFTFVGAHGNGNRFDRTNITASIGYRYQPSGGGLFLQVTYVRVYPLEGNDPVNWGGVAIGASL